MNDNKKIEEKSIIALKKIFKEKPYYNFDENDYNIISRETFEMGMSLFAEEYKSPGTIIEMIQNHKPGSDVGFGKKFISCTALSFAVANLSNFTEEDLQKIYILWSRKFYQNATPEHMAILDLMIDIGNLVRAGFK